MKRNGGTSRRRFLGQVSALVGAPLVVPASSLGAEAAAPPSDRITMGFIGIGMQARGHLGGMLARRDVQVLAVCDCDQFRREDAAKKVNDRYGNNACGCYKDFRDLAARRDIDAVLMAPPDHWHALMTIRCAEAGKDVYCEKPLSLTIRDARAMAHAIRRYGRVFQTGSQQRSGREFRFACEMVRSGRIGKVERVIVNVGGPSRECDLPAQPVPEGLDWDLWLG
ncbi:MAG TPA: Gfo/Idh/MocA family oxidoreductase, partial [Planctomycetota bacterium]|nr:Gfo/Idh/MocA family oxidoreductase [Planctomycetota bacterium]